MTNYFIPPDPRNERKGTHCTSTLVELEDGGCTPSIRCGLTDEGENKSILLFGRGCNSLFKHLPNDMPFLFSLVVL